MKDLGKMIDRPEAVMYPTQPAEKPAKEKQYSHITVPLSILGDKKVKLNEEICICLAGKVKGMHKSDWADDLTIEVREGEVMEGKDAKKEEKEESAEGETMLGK